MFKIVIFLTSTLSVTVDIVYLVPAFNILKESSHTTYGCVVQRNIASRKHSSLLVEGNSAQGGGGGQEYP
jgi:hypothetical protein